MSLVCAITNLRHKNFKHYYMMIFMNTVSVISVKFWIMIVLIELIYLFITFYGDLDHLILTLTLFQANSALKQLKLKVFILSSYLNKSKLHMIIFSVDFGWYSTFREIADAFSDLTKTRKRTEKRIFSPLLRYTSFQSNRSTCVVKSC